MTSDPLHNQVLNRQLLEQNPSALVLVDVGQDDHPIIFVNAAFEQNTGYSRDDVLGLNPRFLQNDDSDQPGVDIMRTALREQKAFTVTLRNYRKDGSMFWNEIRATPIADENGQVTHYLAVQNDVTALKKAEETILQNEIRYRTVVENFPNGMIALYDHDLRYTIADGAGLHAIGLTSAALEGKRLRDIFPPEIYERDEPALRAALAGQPTEVIVPFGDDFFRVLTLPVRDDHGDIINGMVVTQNITALKRAEETLRQREQEFRALVENSTDLISRLTRDSVHLYVNPANARAFGLPAEQIIGKTNAELGVSAQLMPQLDAAREQVFNEKRVVHLEFSYVIDGNERFLEARLNPEFDADGNVETILIVTRDITGRKQTEEALRRSEQMLNEAGTMARVGGWEFDLLTDRVRWTEATRNIHEVTADFETTLEGAVDFYHPEDRPIIAEAVRRAIEDGQPYDLELRFITAKGNLLWIHTLAKTEWRDGKCVRVYGTFQDITERKQAQQREFDVALEKERLRLLTSFIQDATHEFRTPLANINSSAYLISRSDDPEHRREKSQQIEQNVRQLTRLVEMLLKTARLDSQNLDIVALDVSVLVDQLCQRLKYDAPGLLLACQIADGVPSVYADEVLLQDAIEELIDNARRYGPPDAPVAVSVAYIDKQVRIAVRDQGEGMSEDQLQHIFDTFWRGDQARSTPGMGLGLSIARKIVERLGGEMVVESEVGQGSIFSIWLPTAPVTEEV